MSARPRPTAAEVARARDVATSRPTLGPHNAERLARRHYDAARVLAAEIDALAAALAEVRQRVNGSKMPFAPVGQHAREREA